MNAPITYDRAFVGTPERDAFFEHMWSDLPWENREGAPRRECWFNPYGLAYTYGSGEHARTYQAHSFNESYVAQSVWSILRGLNGIYRSEYDCCFVNGYAHGRQHLGWHADDSPEMDLDHPIAVVSLGAERDIWFRRKPEVAEDVNRWPEGGGPDPVGKQLLGHGSALIMHAGMQRTWQHRIPKSPNADCGPRLSLTFRRLVR
jgi:alkylated DNA repair dioxygenase AlkB